MAIEREIWRKDIVEALFKDNQFLSRSFNADEMVLAGKVVHIPNAGAPSGAVRNRSSFPATVTVRSDTDITYALDEITTNPVKIPNIDDLQLSYDKRQSVISQDMSGLLELAAEWLLYKWAPAGTANILRTLGAARAGEANGTVTGNRAKLTKETLKNAQKVLNKQGISKIGRVGLLPSEFLGDLMEDSDLIKRDSSSEVDYKNGIIARLYGFDIMERATVLTYSNAGTPVSKSPEDATAATDNAGALFYHPSSLERALGNVDTFERLNDPQYFGDIYSFLIMCGGRIRRSDAKGVIAVVEASAA